MHLVCSCWRCAIWTWQPLSRPLVPLSGAKSSPFQVSASSGPSLRYEHSVERRSISPTFCVLRKPPSLRLTRTLTQINLDFCVLHRNSNLKNPLCLSNGRSMARPQVLRWHAPLATYHSQPMTNARPITYATLNPIIISVISSRPH